MNYFIIKDKSVDKTKFEFGNHVIHPEGMIVNHTPLKTCIQTVTVIINSLIMDTIKKII